jgi:hypothetical protein
MIHYYTNREISKNLEINLARWKRWSRSFLPPDPLGGMQSGYARQYTFKDLFKVYLGGHLLSHLKLSVPDSQQVLTDLSPWMKKGGFLALNGTNGAIAQAQSQLNGYRIYFCPVTASGLKNASGFCYLVRKRVNVQFDKMPTGRQIKETFEETILNTDATDGCFFFQDPQVRMINFSALYIVLVKKLSPQPQ